MKTTDDLMHRRGIFHINQELLYNNTEAVLKIMARCIVMRCEYLLMSDRLEYHALSYDFDVIGLGECAPMYEVVVAPTGVGFWRVEL